MGIAPIDLTTLRELVKGDRDALLNIVDLFQKQLAEEFAKIQQAVKEGKAHDVDLLCHKAIGSSGTLGCNDLAVLFREIQVCARENRLSDALPLLNEVVKEQENIRVYCKENI